MKTARLSCPSRLALLAACPLIVMTATITLLSVRINGAATQTQEQAVESAVALSHLPCMLQPQ